MVSMRSALGLALVGYLGQADALAANITGTYGALASAAYSLVDTYNSANFFSNFGFFTGSDPTHGWVNYYGQAAAAAAGLYNTNNNQIYLGVDYTTVNPASPGRASIRMTSTATFEHGLFIADIAHMPASICGVWPAFWLFGSNPTWPGSGEIDVIEGVNLAGTDQITLHTKAGCTINTAGSQSGTTLLYSNCNQDSGNTGCGVTTTTANAYGTAFNNNGGGVYAMQWESSGIYVWFFPRNAIPADITAGAPVTGNWGTPIVAFNGGTACNIDSFFMNENIVFDTTFCGDWAGGSAWTSSSCNALGSCTSYVGANPSAFAQAYWLINSVKVYHL